MKLNPKQYLRVSTTGIILLLLGSFAHAAGFNSGSTGADGAFAPGANITVNLPPSGIFNYTTVNIPAGVTVTYTRNASNTAVVILASGNVNIGGSINIGGASAAGGGQGTSGERLGGLGGPGGFDGGRGGMPESNRRGGTGLGPGAGGGGDYTTACCGTFSQGGGGGGSAVAGAHNPFGITSGNTGIGGGIYGTNLMTPLVGGSGGGGGAGSPLFDGFHGVGGGGGGGAILIVSSGTVTLSGSIIATGGSGGGFTTGTLASGTQYGGGGGGASGGAIRVIAPAIFNTGVLNVNGGSAGVHGHGSYAGGAGGRGRVSLEQYAAGTFSLGTVPTLTISSVAGIAAPATPTGTGDVAIPAGTANPVPVVLTTSSIPPGSTVVVKVTPIRGVAPVSVTSPPLAGTTASASATVNVDIPNGLSTITAQMSYTILVAMGEALSQFANNERVERITLSATVGGKSTAKLVTVSGKEYDAPEEALRIAMLQ
ncbi:MAG: hypothetical protein K2Y31_06925 [Burkholderiales bacterium]|jgi:hypothetical protein|nr:hypothetical protein [Burkholderiales bacterium]